MRAVRFHQHGGSDVLRVEDAPEPQLGPGEVLVRVREPCGRLRGFAHAAAFPLTFVTAWHMLITRAQLKRAATWQKSLGALARGGRLVTCGPTTGANAAIDLNALSAKRLSIEGTYMGTKAELADAAAAQARLESSRHFGKIVLEV